MLLAVNFLDLPTFIPALHFLQEGQLTVALCASASVLTSWYYRWQKSKEPKEKSLVVKKMRLFCDFTGVLSGMFLQCIKSCASHDYLFTCLLFLLVQAKFNKSNQVTRKSNGDRTIKQIFYSVVRACVYWFLALSLQ